MSQTQSTWRAPRFRLLANGNVLHGALSVECTANNHYAADHISGDISLSADPAFGLAWWDQQTDIRLEVQMATPGSGADNPAWQTIVLARLDGFRPDLTTNCLTFDGRDLTALLMEAKTQETFSNRTSSEIAQIIAARHGMTASVVPTKTIVGQYYQLEHDRITLDNFSRQTTEWDLLTYLAQEEGYDLWVWGNTLYFQPESANTQQPFRIVYQPSVNGASPFLNVSRVTLERSLTLAKDIEVTVKSTNLRSGKAFIRTVKAAGVRPPGAPHSQTQNYVFVKPGLTPDQALKFGQAKLAELTKHERRITVEMPGEVYLTPRNMVQLAGTGTGFDLTYYIDEISRRISFDEGFMQTLTCKNTSHRSETTVL